jgi:hypothetical protein
MFDINEKGIVIVKPEFLLIECFKKIYDKYPRDKALQIFAFIYFMHDYKSPYKRSYELSELEEKVKVDIFNTTDWTPDEDILEAGKKYDELQQVKSLKTLVAAEQALSQITQYFNDFNINTIPDVRRHQTVNSMMKNLEELDEVIDKISNARKRVESDMLNKNIAGKRKLGKREIPKSQR